MAKILWIFAVFLKDWGLYMKKINRYILNIIPILLSVLMLCSCSNNEIQNKSTSELDFSGNDEIFMSLYGDYQISSSDYWTMSEENVGYYDLWLNGKNNELVYSKIYYVHDLSENATISSILQNEIDELRLMYSSFSLVESLPVQDYDGKQISNTLYKLSTQASNAYLYISNVYIADANAYIIVFQATEAYDFEPYREYFNNMLDSISIAAPRPEYFLNSGSTIYTANNNDFTLSASDKLVNSGSASNYGIWLDGGGVSIGAYLYDTEKFENNDIHEVLNIQAMSFCEGFKKFDLQTEDSKRTSDSSISYLLYLADDGTYKNYVLVAGVTPQKNNPKNNSVIAVAIIPPSIYDAVSDQLFNTLLSVSF